MIEIQNSSIPYLKHNIITGIMILCQGMLLSLVLPGVSVVEATLLSSGIYEIVFDYGLNFFRNKPVFSYFGDFTDKKNLSFIEREVYARLSWKLIGGVKVAFALVTLIVYN